MASRPSDQELLKLETQFWQAIKDQDADTAARLTADPCLVTGAQGAGRIDSRSLGAMMQAPGYSLLRFELKDVQTEWQGDDVVTLAYAVHEELEVEGEGAPVMLDAADTSTWVRRDGQFVCAVHTEALRGDPFGRDKKPAAELAQTQAVAADGKARAQFILTRQFQAPRQLVFEAWSKPEHLAHWWPPPGFTLPTCELALRPGGSFRNCMRSPEGRDYWSHGTYDLVVAPLLLAFTTELDDEPGHQVRTEVSFDEQDGKTTVSVRESFDDTPMTRFALAGLSQCFDLLDGYLAKLTGEPAQPRGDPFVGPAQPHDLEVVVDPARPIIVTRRVVDAPRSLVFEAFTRPEYLSRWFGPRGLSMILSHLDLRVGGDYRFVYRTPEGVEFGFHGSFREIVAPERVVRTFVFEPRPEHEALETLLLEESGGKTTLTTLTVHDSFEVRDGHLAGGQMKAGMAESYARLDELLASLQSGAAPEAGA